MRSKRFNGMVVQPGQHPSSFLSCEKDMEAIVQILFVDDPTYSTLLKALLEVSNNNNVSRYTLKQWYYDHGAKSVNKERKLKVAAMSVSSSRSFDLNSFIRNLNPFKRFLACIIGLDKYLEERR